MAHRDTQKTDPVPAHKRSSVIAPTVAVAIIGVTAFAVFVSTNEEPTLATDDPYQGELEARPPGAGTMPDGVADTMREGLGEGTVAEDVVDQTQSADLVSPIMELDEEDPTPSRTAEGLEPLGDGEGPILQDNPNVDRAEILGEAETAATNEES